MTSGGGRRGRRLSNQDIELWNGVTRSVRPIRTRAPRAAPPSADAPPAPAGRARESGPETGAAVAVAAPKPKAPPVAPLERRMKQKIARGQQPIDAKLDLHGHTQAEAHDALLRFLQAARTRGQRVVLVITGKGGRGQSGGVLRRAVPLWLALPEFRALVIGFDAAAPAHGGDGAFYLRVRKARE